MLKTGKQKQLALEKNRDVSLVPHVLVSAGFKELLQLGGGYAVQLIENFWLQHKVKREAIKFQILAELKDIAAHSAH